MENSIRSNRILVVTPRWGGVAGGAERHLGAFARKLDSLQGVSVEIATSCALDNLTWTNELDAGSRVEDGIRIHRFKAETPPWPLGKIHRRLVRGIKIRRVIDALGWKHFPMRSRALGRFITNHRTSYDAILAGPYFYGTTWDTVLAAPDRTIVLPCVHDEPEACLRRTGFMLRSARKRIFNSVIERDLVAGIHGRVAASGPVIGVGIDRPSEITPETEIREKYNLRGDFLIYLGRSQVGKGLQKVMHAVMDHNSRNQGECVTLVIAGDRGIVPPDSPWIRCVGYVEEGIKNGLLSSALANISFSRMESLSLVLLESWSLGTPSIVDAESTVLNWQIGRSGGGISVHSPAEFSEALRRMRDSSTRQRMGEAGRSLVQSEYSWKTVLEALVKEVEEISGAE